MEIDGVEYGVDVRVFFDIANERYQIQGTIRYQGRDIEISLYYDAGEIYVNIEGIYVKVTREYIEETIAGLELDLSGDIDTTDIENKIYSIRLVERIIEKLENLGTDSISIIKRLEVTGTGIVVEIDKDELGLSKDIKIELGVTNGKISQVEIRDVEIDENKELKELTIAIDYNGEAEEIEASKYLDIETFYDSVQDIIEEITRRLGIELPEIDITNIGTLPAIEINIDQILDYVQEISVTSNKIEIRVGTDISGLDKDVIVELGLESSHIETIRVKYGEEIDVVFGLGNNGTELDLYDFIDNLLALKDINAAGISVRAGAEIGGYEYGINLAGAFNLTEDKYQIQGTIRYQGRDIEISLYYDAGEIYVNIEGIYVKVDKTWIEDIIRENAIELPEIDTEDITNKIEELRIISKLKEFIGNASKDSIGAIKKLEVRGTGIVLIIDKAVFGADTDTRVDITIEEGKIVGINIDNLEIDTNKGINNIELCLDRNELPGNVDEDKYLDIETFYDSVQDIIEEITRRLGIELPEIDITNIGTLPAIEINIDQILDYIEEISVTSNKIEIRVGTDISGLDENIDIMLVLSASKIQTINVKYGENIDICINVDDGEGLNIYDVIDNVLELIEINKAAIRIDGAVEIDGIEYGLDVRVFFDIANERYQIQGTIRYQGRDIEISLYYDAGEIYVNIEGIYVKVTREYIEETIAGLELDLSGDIDTTDIENKIYSLRLVERIIEKLENLGTDSISIIKRLEVTETGIVVEIDKDELGLSKDIKIEIGITNGKISQVEIRDIEIDENKELKELTIEIDYNGEAEEIEASKYLDIETLINNIKALETASNIYAEIELNLFEKQNNNYISKFDASGIIQKQQTINDLQSFADFILNYNGNTFNLKGKLEDSTIFADVSGFKLRIDSNKVLYALHKILGLIEQDTNEYDDLINRLLNVLGGEAISSAFVDFDFVLHGAGDIADLTNNININTNDLIDEILSGIMVQSDKIIIKFNCDCLGFDKYVDLEIVLQGNNIKQLSLNKLEVNDMFIDASIEFKDENAELSKLTNDQKMPYIDIKELADLAEIVYETIKNGTVSGTVELAFNFGGNVNNIVANYGVKLSDSGLNAYLTTIFNGLTFNLYYIDGVFYLDVGGVSNNANNRLQIKATFEEHEELFAWMEQEFGFNPLEMLQTAFGFDEPLDLNNIRSILKGETSLDFDINNMLNMLANIDLGFINNIEFGDNSFSASLVNDINLGLYWDSLISRITLTYNDLSVDLTCTDYSDIVFTNIGQGNYSSYTVITNAISCVMNTISSSPLEFYVDADIYRGGEQTKYLNVGYQDEKLYLDYYGMKISIARNSLSQVLSMILEVLGLDPQLAGFIGDVADTSELDTTNLQAALPALDFGNPFTMLRYIKKISLNGGVFTLLIDSEMFNSTTGQDFEIKLSTSANKISQLEINNVYTNADNNDYINTTIVFERRIAANTYSSYIDLSNSVDLIRAFINTSQLDDYLIQGKIMLSVMSINAAKIDVDVRVKLDENNNPTIVATLSNYPMIVEVNDANTNERGGTLTQMRYRTITIYFKNGELFLKTYDDAYKYKLGLITVADYASYERITRITPAYLISNIKYYVEWLLGFTSTIESKINDAIDQSMNYTGNDDYSNIILSYTKSGNNHVIELNLKKLAHNDDIGTLSLTISSICNASTGNKDYLYSLGMNLVMLDSLITLKTDSSNQLYLKNIGQAVDVSAASSFINNYPYNPYGEYAKEGSGAYSQKNSKTITITLNNNGGTGTTSLSGNLASNMTLPTPSRIIDNGTTRTTYSFVGWYDTDGNLCTLTYFPASNMTLIAHWELESVQYYKTLTIVKNNGESNTSSTVLQWTIINVPALLDYVVDNTISKTSYTFMGWEYNGENIGTALSFAIAENMTIYGIWQEDVVYYRTATFDSNNGTSVPNNKQLEGTVIILPATTKDTFDNNITRIVYTFAGWSDGDHVYVGGSEYTLTQDVLFVALFDEDVKYYYNIEVHNNNGSQNYTVRNLEGSQLVVSALSDYVVDDGITKTSYTFIGWMLNGYNLGLSITVDFDNNKIIEGIWQEDVVYYRTATFDSNNAASVPNSKQIEGTTITLPIISKDTYDNGIINVVYTFTGWSNGEQIYVGGTTYTLTQDVQFVAVFNEYTREYHSITIINDMLGTNKTIKELCDHEPYILPVHDTHIVEQENIRYYYDFVCYKDQNNNIITEYDFSSNVEAFANYIEDVSRRVYISTLTVYNYDNSILLQQTKTNGEEITLPTLPNIVEYDEVVGGRNYHVVLNFDGYSQVLTEMPNHDVDIFANYTEVSRRGYYTLNIYNINTSNGQINNCIVSAVLLEGEAITYPTLDVTEYNLTINSETGRWVFNGWDTSTVVMPANDLVVRATYLTYYTLTFYDINSSNGQITRQLSSTQVLVGSNISYPTISTTSYRINNSDGSYKMYNYTGWDCSDTRMPSRNLTIRATYSVTTYYKVQFDVSWYKPSWWITSGTIKTSPTAPATQYVAAGTDMNLSGYSATIKVKYGINYTYSTKGWSTSKASNGTTAINRVTVNSNLTLYAVWDH